MVGVDAGSLQLDLDLALLRLGGVEAEAAIEVLEGTVQPAVAEVADLEVDEGVLAFLVDLVVGGHGLGAEQQGTEAQGQQGFLQHGMTP
jgi:hypothetical protein